MNAALLEDAKFGWDESPVSVPRMIAELGEQIKNDDWAIVSGHQFTGDWQRRLLNFDKYYRYNGDCGGFGIGYDAPGCVGAALAHGSRGGWRSASSVTATSTMSGRVRCGRPRITRFRYSS